MDKVLGTRNLASATVRKQRMQERQKQKETLHQQREERKKRLQRYSQIYTSESGSDISRSASPENDSATGSPSEYSVATPDNAVSPEFDIRIDGVDLALTNVLKNDAELKTSRASTLLDRRASRLNATQPTSMGASLNRLSDFRYDRYSAVYERLDLTRDDSESSVSEVSSDEDEDDEDDEDYSPIEIATPVALRIPTSKPSVISVTNPPASSKGPQRFSVKNINSIMLKPPQPKPRQPEPIYESTKLNASGFLASEAQPIQVVTPASESVISFGAPPSPSPQPSEHSTDTSVKRKSSRPMLTRFTHARMSSIKSFIKPQSISGPPPAVPMIPTAHQSRPSESLNRILLSASSHKKKSSEVVIQGSASPRRSLSGPPALQTTFTEVRPQTARAPSRSSMMPFSHSSEVRPTSILPPPSPITSRPLAEETDASAMSRKKSFSTFRRRSGSLGQALKFSNNNRSRSTLLDESAPPMPALNYPTNESVTSLNVRTSAPKQTKSVRKSGMAMYSAFPPPMRPETAGLGLLM